MNTLCLLGLPLGGRTLGAGILDYQVTIKRTFGPRITVLVFSGDRYQNITQIIRLQHGILFWEDTPKELRMLVILLQISQTRFRFYSRYSHHFTTPPEMRR